MAYAPIPPVNPYINQRATIRYVFNSRDELLEYILKCSTVRLTSTPVWHHLDKGPITVDVLVDGDTRILTILPAIREITFELAITPDKE